MLIPILYLVVIFVLLVAIGIWLFMASGWWRLLPVGALILLGIGAWLLYPKLVTAPLTERFGTSCQECSGVDTSLITNPVPHTYEIDLGNIDCTEYSWVVTVPNGTFVSDSPLEGVWEDDQKATYIPFITITWDDGFVQENIQLWSIIRPDTCKAPIIDCPTASLGTHPYSGEPLIYAADPYPGVMCEYEVYSETNTRIIFSGGHTALVADWASSCPSGPECEGVWFANDKFTAPATWLQHIYVYYNGYVGAARFPSFACEYILYGNKGHTDANIRVPDWVAMGSGTILNHPGCPLP